MKVGIAGGGIMGQLMALSLVHAGWKVVLFDASNPGNCSMAAAGMLSPVAELEKNDVIIYHMGVAALTRHWPDIISCLHENIYFKTAGSLLLAHPRDRTTLHHTAKAIMTKTPAQHDVRHLAQAEITTLEPAITKFAEGYYLQTEGQIDNQQLLTALETNLTACGVIWHHDTVVTRVTSGYLEVGSNRYQFDLVLDCRGLGAKQNFQTLRGLRGELIWLHAPDVHISRPVRFLHPRYGLYIVPRSNNIYLIGASEIEANDYSAISVRTLLELLTAAYYVSADFSEARVIKTVTQCRPTFTHHLPEIIKSDNLIAINGLYRHGYLIAPTLANEVMNYLQHGSAHLKYPQLWRNAA